MKNQTTKFSLFSQLNLLNVSVALSGNSAEKLFEENFDEFIKMADMVDLFGFFDKIFVIYKIYTFFYKLGFLH
jgi:hypothetical protein